MRKLEPETLHRFGLELTAERYGVPPEEVASVGLLDPRRRFAKPLHEAREAVIQRWSMLGLL